MAGLSGWHRQSRVGLAGRNCRGRLGEINGRVLAGLHVHLFFRVTVGRFPSRCFGE